MCFFEVDDIRNGFDEAIDKVAANENLPEEIKRSVESTAKQIRRYVFDKFFNGLSSLVDMSEKTKGECKKSSCCCRGGNKCKCRKPAAHDLFPEFDWGGLSDDIHSLLTGEDLRKKTRPDDEDDDDDIDDEEGDEADDDIFVDADTVDLDPQPKRCRCGKKSNLMIHKLANGDLLKIYSDDGIDISVEEDTEAKIGKGGKVSRDHTVTVKAVHK